MAKRKIKPVPKYLQDNKKALKAISWAFRSDLRAYPIPSGSEYHIEIDNGLKRIKSLLKAQEIAFNAFLLSCKYFGTGFILRFATLLNLQRRYEYPIEFTSVRWK